MTLSDYFGSKKGLGVLATSDRDGRVDAAVYAKPHFMDDGTVAFIMRDRLTHHNLTSNPHATYLFVEDGSRSNGTRLFLTKQREETESELLYKLRRRKYASDSNGADDPKFLVFFKIDKQLPLVGGDRID
jgi:hypothetical protein